MGQGLGQTDRAPPRRPATVVGAGVVIRGDIESACDLRLRGLVVGKVAVADLTVEGGALIDGPVTAEAVCISGRVIGPVHARTVHLLATARMEGDVTCESLQIEPGARFIGRCNAEDGSGEDFASTPAGLESDGDLGDAGQEFLRLAARLRRTYQVDASAGRTQRSR